MRCQNAKKMQSMIALDVWLPNALITVMRWPKMLLHTVSDSGDHLDACYDEHGLCYGCKLRDAKYGFQACNTCPWVACPMRGGKKGDA